MNGQIAEQAEKSLMAILLRLEKGKATAEEVQALTAIATILSSPILC